MLSVPAELYADIYMSPAEARAAACTCKWAARHINTWVIFTKKPLWVAPYNPNNIIIQSRRHTYKYDTGLSGAKMWYDDRYIKLTYRYDTDAIGYSPRTTMCALPDCVGGAYSDVVWLWRVFSLDRAEMPHDLVY